MDSYRIKVKVGDHEFEAEGPAEIVQSQFESPYVEHSAYPGRGEGE
jgi:hypothetical protein